MQPEIPIETRHLFPELNDRLIELLQSLSPEEWTFPTIAKKWQVKDIAAHILDTNIRTLSFGRDNWMLKTDRDLSSYELLVSYLNDLNADWVQAFKRTSPGILVELLILTGKQFNEYIQTLDPFSPSIFSVAWAGESVSYNWFHVAREFTEKFIHQQQIRDAVKRSSLTETHLFYPFIDTLLQGLPHAYRNQKADTGTLIKIQISTEFGGVWWLMKRESGWLLLKNPEDKPRTEIVISPGTAWKLFSKGIKPEEALSDIQITGDESLAWPVIRMVSVMA